MSSIYSGLRKKSSALILLYPNVQQFVNRQHSLNKMSPFSRRDVPYVTSLCCGQLLSNCDCLFSAKAGSSSNMTGDRNKQWFNLFDWKTPELKLPKLSRGGSFKKSKTEQNIEIETVPKAEPTPSHYSELNTLPPPADTVAESPLVSSVPVETTPSPTLDYSPSLLDLFPLNLSSSPPPTSERHSSSSSDYGGHSYRSRSSSGPSIYRGSEPSFPYPSTFEFLVPKPNVNKSLDRQSSGSWSSISPPPIPELNRTPSPICGPSTLGVDQFQDQANAILERFIKHGDVAGGGAQFLREPDKKDGESPTEETEAVRNLSMQAPRPRSRESQSEPPCSILRPPPSTNRAFSTDTPSLTKIGFLRSRPIKGGAMPSPNKNASSLPTAQTKDFYDIATRRQAVVADPFPFPFIEDSDDEIVIDVKPHLSIARDVGKYKERTPFSSPIVEDDWG